MTVEHVQISTAEVEPPTAVSTVGEPPSPPATAQLIPQVSALRFRADSVRQEAVSLDRAVFDLNLEERTADFDRLSVPSLLERLSAAGIGWSALARMVRVSVPAIRKWRMGEGASPANRHALARLVAFLDMLADQFMIEDPASWLEIPLAETRYALIDLYAGGRLELILEYAGSRISSPERLLDEFDPVWRTTVSTRQFETFVASDGELGIRRIPR